MKRNAWIFGFCLFILSCQQGGAPSEEKSVEEIMTSDKFTNADLIRNPISASDQLDTINVAKMVFVETKYDFGAVVEGDIVSYVFNFTNQGKMPLVITSARSTCGCTVPEWPDTPVPPGKTGEIKVKFNTAGKRGLQKKPVNITANTYPSVTTVNLEGVVNEKRTTSVTSTQ